MNKRGLMMIMTQLMQMR